MLLTLCINGLALTTSLVFASENRISTDHKLWPKGDKWFTRRLNQISSNLLEGFGIDVQISRVTSVKGKYNTASISIRKMTPVTRVTPVILNYAQILGKRLETYLPLKTDDSSEENDSSEVAENHAQNTVTGETGETGDIFSTKGDSRLYRYICYHCNDFQTNNQDYYENHMARKHFQLPAYPSITDLQRHGLKAQGKEWER